MVGIGSTRDGKPRAGAFVWAAQPTCQASWGGGLPGKGASPGDHFFPNLRRAAFRSDIRCRPSFRSSECVQPGGKRFRLPRAHKGVWNSRLQYIGDFESLSEGRPAKPASLSAKAEKLAAAAPQAAAQAAEAAAREAALKVAMNFVRARCASLNASVSRSDADMRL